MIELCRSNDDFPVSDVELLRSEDMGDGGGIPGFETAYLAVLLMKGDVLPDLA